MSTVRLRATLVGLCCLGLCVSVATQSAPVPRSNIIGGGGSSGMPISSSVRARPDLSRVGFRLGAVSGSVPTSAVSSDGTFEMRGLSEPTRFVLASGPSGWWLRSFVIDGVNAADEPVMLERASGAVHQADVVLSRTGRISGAVVDAGGAAVAKYTVATPLDVTPLR